MTNRLLFLTVLLLATAVYVATATESEPIRTGDALHKMPLQLDEWRGRNDPPFPDNILEQLGVDEYVVRSYARPSEPWIALYVGFYGSQRQGDTMHSPLNCLPGAGWLPVQQGRLTMDVPNASGTTESITVNHFVIQKGLERQLVLYWYQSHGRVVASEYTSKLYMVADAVRLNRTDGALVRVITPIFDNVENEKTASERAQAFVRTLFPELVRALPS